MFIGLCVYTTTTEREGGTDGLTQARGEVGIGILPYLPDLYDVIHITPLKSTTYKIS